MNEVFITGLGPVAPNGIGKEEFWEALKAGKSGIRRITRFDNSQYPAQIGGEIPREWLAEREPFSESGSRSWSSHLLIHAARLALEDAGLSRDEFRSYDPTIWAGVSTNDAEMVERELDSFRASSVARSYLLGSSPHAAASEIASELKCSGKVVTFSTGCSSGIVSIAYAAEAIRNGEVPIALAGGGDGPLTPFVMASFFEAGMVPLFSGETGDEPACYSKPFDMNRQGGIMAEGAGMLVLESSELARRRGTFNGVALCGWGISNASSERGIQKALVISMKDALKMAQLTPDMIDHISAHAPGAKFIDAVETFAIKEVFGGHAYNIPVSSIKSMIGNPLAGAGPLQLIAAVQSIVHKYVPPTINYQNHDPKCDLDCTPNKGHSCRIQRVLINTKGIGGSVVSMVISEIK